MRKHKKKYKEVLQVLSFTIKQQLKTKSFQIGLVVALVTAFFGPFVAALFWQEDEMKKPDATTIETIYVVEKLESKLDITYEQLKENSFYNGIKIVEVSAEDTKEIEYIKEELEYTENREVLLEIREGGEFVIKIYTPPNGNLWEGEGSYLQDEIEQLLREAVEEKTGLSGKQKKIVNTSIDTRVQVIDSNGRTKNLEEENGIAYGEYTCIYGFIFLLLMLGIYAGNMIASFVVSEKNGKVLEYLLTFVSPLSLLSGKIIAAFLLVGGELLCVGFVAKISDYFASGTTGKNSSVLAEFVPDTILERLDISTGILLIVFVLLNLLFFGFLAALAGTRAGRIEELKDTMIIFSVGELVGGYLAMFCAVYMMEESGGIFVNAACLFPLSSSFLLPGAILTGKADGKLVLGAALLLGSCVGILIRITVKSYQEHLFVSKDKKRKT